MKKLILLLFATVVCFSGYTQSDSANYARSDSLIPIEMILNILELGSEREGEIVRLLPDYNVSCKDVINSTAWEVIKMPRQLLCSRKDRKKGSYEKIWVNEYGVHLQYYAEIYNAYIEKFIASKFFYETYGDGKTNDKYMINDIVANMVGKDKKERVIKAEISIALPAYPHLNKGILYNISLSY